MSKTPRHLRDWLAQEIQAKKDRKSMHGCTFCNEGLVRFDPQTGDTRCGNCGVSPAFLGGQDHTPESVEKTGSLLFSIILTACLFFVGLTLVGLTLGAWLVLHGHWPYR